MYVGVVLNPMARKNRTHVETRAQRLQRTLGPWGEVVVTREVEQLGEAVRRLLPRATHLVSDGGDGALHWLMNEVRRQLGDHTERWPTMLPTNGGTIDFVGRKVRVRGQSAGLVRALAAAAAADRPPPEVELDTLWLHGTCVDGASFDRIGFALAAGGVGNRFFDKYYEDPEPSPATIVRVITRTVADFGARRFGLRRGARRSEPSYAAHLFRPTRARVEIDGQELPTQVHGGIHAGAFDVNLGGVLRVFPMARDPGVLHFQAGEITPPEIIANLPALVAGGAIRGKRMRDTAGARMVVDSVDEPIDPVIDGERFRGLRRLIVEAGPRVRIARVSS